MMLAQHNYPSRSHPHPQYYNNPQPHPHQQQHLDIGSTPTYPSTTSLSTLDNIPAAAAAIAASQRYRTPTTQSQPQPQSRPQSHPQSQSQQGFDGGNGSQGLNQVPDLMPSDSWMLHSNQQTPRAAQRLGHQRESSLSSLGSNGPASPYNANTSNPQIAVADAGSDGYHDMSNGDSNYSYNLAKPMAMSDNFYASALASFNNQHHGNGHNGSADMSSADGQSNGSAQQQRLRSDRGLAPAPELSRSHPVSVASSIAGGDSPVTPSFHEPEDDGRRSKNVFTNNNVPKLDRTMTDVYNDELFNPNFTITSASPPPQTHMAMSPSSELFAQRLQAANSQHLSAVQSPVSNPSRDRSPFRQGSPYASSVHDFPQVGMNQGRIGSAQQIREKRKTEQDAKELQHQMARNSNQQQGTPSTISPKDAVLEFNESDESSNFPLFPAQETDKLNLGQANDSHGSKAMASQQSSPAFQSMASTPIQNGFNFSMPSNIQVPQQYPFIARRQQVPQQSTPSSASFSRMSSAEASHSDGGDSPLRKPGRTNADGGTYTCTYHGCTLRFETPALLQKHKREGHRQANALHHVRATPATPTAMVGDVLNSQAGPHRCDRINPSTGKPCSTVFSRPYDLTRHEDTIHNARKQKVRCDLCTEEKTFSRADALTRHYRVCHPDVEFPGKHRRRGAVGV